MQLRHTLAAACIACGALVSTPASAVFVSSFDTAPGNAVTDFSSTGLAAINLDLAQAGGTTTVTFQIEQADIAAGNSVGFNAVIANLFGYGIRQFLLEVHDATFAFIGSVESGFGGSTATVAGGPQAARIVFNPEESFGFNIGDPFQSGAEDWRLSIAGLAAGDSFSVRFAVPEPGSLPLVLAGLLGAGWIGSRRRRTLQ